MVATASAHKNAAEEINICMNCPLPDCMPSSKRCPLYKAFNRQTPAEYQLAYNRENREKINARQRERRRKTKKNTAAYQREWRRKNPEKVKEYDRRNREKNKAARLEYQRQYRAENREKVNALARKRWAEKKGNKS